MTGPRRFDPEELGTGRAPRRESADGRSGADEPDGAALAAAWLEAAMLDSPVRPTPDFSDRVMTALASEPTPAAAGFLTPLRRQGLVAGFQASVRQAWAAAFSGGRPAFVRAPALAYVLAVAIAGTALAGMATLGVGGVLGILGPSATQTTSPETPMPASPDVPSSLEPPMSASPQASDEPGESASPSAIEEGGGTGPDASDDDGAGASSGPGSSGSDSDDHSDDSETGTPRPSSTPPASGTPKPTQTSGSGGSDDE